ncbi:MAG: hydratase [Thermotaleaceae bacterium]
MIDVIDRGIYLFNGSILLGHKSQFSEEDLYSLVQNTEHSDMNIKELYKIEKARKNTITFRILMNHNTTDSEQNLKIKFDSLASHDITYVGIIQTAKASGLESFPLPYVLTNCHNSLCAVGGTINEDDHFFGLSAAKKYGGIYVPAHQAVIHQYMREMMTACGSMILGSDSHTRYGPLGTMGIGEGGPELVKQLLDKTYDITYPEVVAVYLEGTPASGVGPQDVALAIIGAVFDKGFVKNKVLEFVGPGISNLSVDFRNGIDVMTTETTCLSSIWCTDDKVQEYYEIHRRPQDYSKLEPGLLTYYDGLVHVDLSKIQPMIALPFHPSNVFTISELNQNTIDILRTIEAEGQKQIDNPNIQFQLTDKLSNGRIKVDQGIVAGCSGGTYENIVKMSHILSQQAIGSDYFNMSIYPASQPIYMELVQNGSALELMKAGVTMKTAFCGPCFGAGDVPANNSLSIRHTTRNFPNREGSKPSSGQIASVALMDALSIAATAANSGFLTPATEINLPNTAIGYTFREEVYKNRVYKGFHMPQPQEQLKYGPNIADWPRMDSLSENILLELVSVIQDPITTTDELIPSGETSSYRSNPLKLAEFTLSRKDPHYVERAKSVQNLNEKIKCFVKGDRSVELENIKEILSKGTGVESLSHAFLEETLKTTHFGSTIFARKPGDGSAREQAASCQKVLGGLANIAIEYATKRYRSNLINWGMLPFTISQEQSQDFQIGDYIFIKGIRDAILNGQEDIPAVCISPHGSRNILLHVHDLSQDEKDIILAGSLINYYAIDKG